MDNSNPPSLQVATSDVQLAGRWNRLGAALIDTVIMLAIILPIEFASGFLQLVMDTVRTHEQLPLSTLLPWDLLGLAVFILVQGYPLVKDGQTWGKKVLSIKIVDMGGRKPSMQQLSIRYAFYMFLGFIPIVGPLANLINVCLIFRSDKRCGHDLVAGTRVVEATQLRA